MPRPTKKRRQSGLARLPTTACTSLTSLPIEILAQVLLYTCSPPTVLAVSRTCSFLYRTLAQNPASSFIWRGVRKTCKPCPLPDPGDCWHKSEADFAALVFGGGVCEVCRKNTRAMYVSFAVRIRLCGSWYCRRKFLNEFLVDVSTMCPKEFAFWMPYVESNQCFRPSSFPALTWPLLDNILVRKTDLEKFHLEVIASVSPNSASAEDGDRKCFVERRYAAMQRFPVIMQLSVRLIHWKAVHDWKYEENKRHNQRWTKNLAENEGWNLEDLIASQTYASLQNRKNFLLEAMTSDDVYPVRSAIESELLAIQARHKRKHSEGVYKTKLSEVKKIYEHMRCGTLKDIYKGTSDASEPIILPPLSIFCTLPSVRVLKGSPDPSVLPPNSVFASSDIKSSPLAMSLIVSDIQTWLVPVQTHLMRLLGYSSGWESASTRTLPPLKRVTARFFCRRCGEGKVGRGYQRERCLDLKGVCSHVCVAAQRKSIQRRHQEAPPEGKIEGVTGAGDGQEKEQSRGKKSTGVKVPDWVVNIFDKDDKAINLIKIILKLTDLSEEDPSTAAKLNAKGGIIRCMTCRGWIVMDFESAIGHVHRHETMEIELVSRFAPKHVAIMQKDPKANCSIPNSRLAFERGISDILMGSSYRGQNLCNMVNYGCKHCSLVDVRVGLDRALKRKGAKAMTFNGLRSHVKEMHGIRDIRDEDFFCYTSIQQGDGERRRG